MPKQEIKKVSEVPQEHIVDFFDRRDVSPDITRWKYFDSEFNAGRNRGFVALSEGRPIGFIGLIPFQAAVGSEVIDTAWTCDWHIDEEFRSSMIGILLLKKAIASYSSVFHTGGNDKTRKVFSRLASHTDVSGVSSYRCDLRLGTQIRRIKARLPWTRVAPLDLLARLPLFGKVRRKSKSEGVLERGLSDSFLSNIAHQFYETDYHPVYDQEYIKWQLERCPHLECFTFRSETGVTAVAWYVKEPNTDWRVVFCQSVPNSVDLESCLQSAKALAFDQGADSIRVLGSREDTQLRTTLLSSGFDQGESYYYYAFSRPGDVPKGCMSGLSFLDVDFAYL